MTKPFPPALSGCFKNGTPLTEASEPARHRREPLAPMPLPVKRHASCRVCGHSERTRIEMLHTAGLGIDKLGEQFGIHRDAIWRHMTNHVTAEVKASYLLGKAKIADLANAAAAESRSLIDYYGIARSLVVNQLDRAAQANRGFEVERLAGRLVEILKEMGVVTGEVSRMASTIINVQNNHTQILNSQPFLTLQAGLLQVCAKHPEARPDIIALFRSLDDQQAAPDTKMIEGSVMEAV